MVQLSPDTITGGDNGNGYNYCHNTIEGFSFNHMSGIGWYGDLGNLQIMPVINETEELQSENLKEFSHEDVGLILDYGDSVTEPIILKCGISYTSLDGARKKLKAEMTDFDFENRRYFKSRAFKRTSNRLF